MTDVFDEICEDLTNDLDMSQVATFTPEVGDAVSLRVAVAIEAAFQPGGLEAQAWGSETTIEYLLSDIGREANRDETFTVNGVTYTVKDVAENDGVFVKVNVK